VSKKLDDVKRCKKDICAHHTPFQIEKAPVCRPGMHWLKVQPIPIFALMISAGQFKIS
jgi:hypothetical protein